MTKAKRNIIKIKPHYLWLLLFVVGYVIIGLILKDERRKSLYENRNETTAVVSDFYSINFVYYYKYTFSVDGKEYTGSAKRNPKIDDVQIGDTLFVVYDRENPNNNEPIIYKTP